MPQLPVPSAEKLLGGPGYVPVTSSPCTSLPSPFLIVTMGSTSTPSKPSQGPPPHPWHEAQQDEGPTDGPDTLSWDDTQAQFSLGAEAMSQGSEGSPVLFLDPAACDDILADLRGADEHLPSFSDDSEPGTPSPTLEAEETNGERATQTSQVPTHDQSTSILPVPVSTSDQATQVIGHPHQASSFTQTPSSAPISDQSTHVLLRPPRSVAYTQTATAAKSTRTSWPQVPRPLLEDAGTDMQTVTTRSTECPAGCFFNNELIPPGAPRPKLPLAYTYAQFDQLL